MPSRTLRRCAVPIHLLVLLGTGGVGTLAGQAVDRDRWCRDSDHERPTACEVREFTLERTDRMRVDAAPNGGIEVTGWDQPTIRVFAKVSASGHTDAEAASLMREVTVRADAGLVESDGPRSRGRRWWSVSYRIFVPRQTGLRLASVNGGIEVRAVHGDIDLRTTNGGLELEDVGGRVVGRTTNGSLTLRLNGATWNGTGAELETTNGSVRLWIPEDYSAMVRTGTVNGTLETDFPITLQGRLPRRELHLTLGGGGPEIRAMTTNGSVSLRRP